MERRATIFGWVASVTLGLACALVLGAAVGAGEPESDGFRIEGGMATLGGGETLVSAGWRIELGVLGDATPGAALAGGALVLRSASPAALAPAVEVGGVRFDAPQALRWTAAPAAASWTLYRGDLGQPSTASCVATDLGAPTAPASADPPAGTGHIYLVTATDRRARESTPGTATDGTPRTLTPCP